MRTPGTAWINKFVEQFWREGVSCFYGYDMVWYGKVRYVFLGQAVLIFFISGCFVSRVIGEPVEAGGNKMWHHSTRRISLIYCVFSVGMRDFRGLLLT